MPIHNLRHYRKPKPNPGFLGSHKRIKNFLAQLFRHARAGVGQHNLHSIAIILRNAPNLDSQVASVSFHRFVGILHKVEKRLLAQTLIERHQRQICVIVAFDLHRLPFPSRRHHVKRAVKNCRQVGRLQLRVQRPGEVQKLGDQRAQPVDLRRDVTSQFARQLVGGLQFLRQHLRRPLDHAQRIANLMRQSSRELSQRSQSLGATRLRLRLLQTPVRFREPFRQIAVEFSLVPALQRETVDHHGREKEKHHTQTE